MDFLFKLKFKCIFLAELFHEMSVCQNKETLKFAAQSKTLTQSCRLC